MRKKLIILVLAVFMCVTVAGCEGELIPVERHSDYKIILNAGSCYAYTFQDAETGIWYIATQGGITPRLNADGSLYITEVFDYE